MFREWFTSRAPRPSAPAHGRPELEALEDRLAPALVGGFPQAPAASISSPAPPTISSGVPGFQGVFPTTSIGPFGLFPGSFALVALDGGYLGPSAAATPSGGGNAASGGAPMNPLMQLQQLARNLYLMAAQQNVQQANTLVIDEVFRATDTFVLLRGEEMGLSNPSLQADAAAHQTAINQNPLSQTMPGQVLGPLVFDLAIYLYASGQGQPI